jgi:hypothetical protein
VANYVRRPVLIFVIQDYKLRHYSASCTAGAWVLAVTSADFCYFVYVMFRFRVLSEQASGRLLTNCMGVPYLPS